MKLDILEIILWPKASHPPRRVIFKPGKINVISGDSKTGKSAIVPIIDYCLGAHHCAIPTGTIRDACAWFGLIVDTAEGKKLIARREPAGQQSTDLMYMLDEDSLRIPDRDELRIPDRISAHNHTAGQLRALLNRIAGTSNLELDSDSQAIGAQRPSIRDFMAFVFQPQNVVANPDVFFFKADTTEHREKLKSIFPYVLGALNAQTLIDRARLDRLSRELSRKERELRNMQSVSVRWQSEARSWLDRARELGLVPKDRADPADWPSLVDLLRELASRSFDDAKPSAEAIDESLRQTLQLVDDERQLAGEVFELRQRYNEVIALRDTSEAHGAALRIQNDRLSLSTWLKGLTVRESPHPLIDPRLSPSTELDMLCDALARLEAEALRRPASAETVDKEITRLQGLLSTKLEDLHALRTRLEARQGLRKSTGPAYSIANIERFLGQLENALETYQKIGSDSELAVEVDSLRQQVGFLQQRVSEQQIRRRTENALQIVQGIAAEIIPKLDCEFVGMPIEISIANLSIRVVGPERKDWLWEIGSGANWLSYHIAVTAALQRFFMQTPSHPVPHLLVYDQPSQVYFPRKLADEGCSDKEEQTSTPASKDKLPDKDVEAVRKVFMALSDEVRTAKSKLQIIVLDHAAEEVWGTVENVHLVEHWRDGKKLVPLEWITDQTR